MRHRLWTGIIFAVLAVCVVAQPASKTTAAKPAAQQKTRAVDLPVEPDAAEHRSTPATLRAAAEANDFDSFESIYQRASKRGEALGAFVDLHEIWSYAQSDPAGAFFGTDQYSRLASRYPDFAAYIREYGVTDRNGQVFYPSRETRAFLLAQAIADVDPLVQPAKKAPTAAPAVPEKTAPVASPATAPKRELHASEALSAPPVETPQPQAKASTFAPPVTEPPPSADALSSDIAAASTAKPAPKREFSAADVLTGDSARGIFLIIIGLLGVGFLTVTMQTPAGGAHDDEGGGNGDAGFHS